MNFIKWLLFLWRRKKNNKLQIKYGIIKKKIEKKLWNKYYEKSTVFEQCRQSTESLELFSQCECHVERNESSVRFINMRTPCVAGESQCGVENKKTTVEVFDSKGEIICIFECKFKNRAPKSPFASMTIYYTILYFEMKNRLPDKNRERKMIINYKSFLFFMYNSFNSHLVKSFEIRTMIWMTSAIIHILIKKEA